MIEHLLIVDDDKEICAAVPVHDRAEQHRTDEDRVRWRPCLCRKRAMAEAAA
jgi:hypothetical protein